MHAFATKSIGTKCVFDHEMIATARTAKSSDADVGYNESDRECGKRADNKYGRIGEVNNKERSWQRANESSDREAIPQPKLLQLIEIFNHGA